ncbi:MAG: tRNA pseudouridine(38-40) synthase TruA [Thermoanaerobaculia bacterium]
MRFLLTLQYLGTRYGGWQTQVNATCVQAIVEAALGKLFGSKVRVHGAGRTDAGVHARAQRAHLDAPFDIPPRGLLLGANQLLPPDIRVTAVTPVADDFHARFSAVSKTYEYRIWNSEVLDVFASETHAHVARALDSGAMAEAAPTLRGEHDFRSYTVTEPEVATTVRTVHDIAVERQGERITITVSADGFLRYMVRRVAGSLIEVGAGRLPGDAIAAALEPAFGEARWTAPAKGLVLQEIRYPESPRQPHP